MIVKVFRSDFSPQIRVGSRFHNMAKGELKLWKTLNLVKKAPYTRGVLLYKKNGDAHHTLRGGPLKKLMGGWVVFFQLALLWNFFSRSLPPQDFFFSSFSCLLESGGLYCCNLNLDTRHNHDHCLYRISFFRALVACSSRGDSTVAILILTLTTI